MIPKVTTIVFLSFKGKRPYQGNRRKFIQGKAMHVKAALAISCTSINHGVIIRTSLYFLGSE
jgi:hypothetical protein